MQPLVLAAFHLPASGALKAGAYGVIPYVSSVANLSSPFWLGHPDGRPANAEWNLAVSRHQDGVWRSADEVPMTADGRLQAHVALDGHGSYPQSGFIPRVFFAFNDRTSTKGALGVELGVAYQPGYLLSIASGA